MRWSWRSGDVAGPTPCCIIRTKAAKADSTGRCNILDMNVCEQLVEGFGGSLPAQRFARARIDGVGTLGATVRAGERRPFGFLV